jgi:hypothetical protein
VVKHGPSALAEWSRESLRTCASFEVDFHAAGQEKGSVAAARNGQDHTAPNRSLTVDEVAVLAALKVEGPLPPALREQVRNCDQLLARLILDGLIEVRRDGRFQSGASALFHESGDPPRESGASGAADISELALEYALAVRHLAPGVLAERLYAFNSLPRKTFSPGDASAEYAAQTGVDAGSPAPKIGGREWSAQTDPGWLYFRRGNPSGGRFKIYLSPRPPDIPRVIHSFADALGGRSGGSSVFKMAFPAAALRRPDKIVAYMPTFDALQRTLSRLVDLSLEATVQAVPFSAPVPRAPVLSWGVDPPNEATGEAIGTGSSWRSWLSRQVAVCAHAIPRTEAPAAALEHLKLALQLREIDPVNWLPRQQLLSREWRLEL